MHLAEVRQGELRGLRVSLASRAGSRHARRLTRKSMTGPVSRSGRGNQRAVQSIMAEHAVIGMDWYAPGSVDQVPGKEKERREEGRGAYKNARRRSDRGRLRLRLRRR